MVPFDTDPHSWSCTIRHAACAHLARGASHSESNRERHSTAGTTARKIPLRSPCFILKHPRTQDALHPGETETVPYRGHRIAPPSVPGLFEALLPQIPSHVVGVIYMPQKISGIDADSKRPPAMALAKGASPPPSYVYRRGHLYSATGVTSSNDQATYELIGSLRITNEISRIMRNKLKRKYDVDVPLDITGRMPGISPAGETVKLTNSRFAIDRLRRPRWYPYPRGTSSCPPPRLLDSSGRSSSSFSSRSPDPRYQNHASILRVFVGRRLQSLSRAERAASESSVSSDQLLVASFVGDRYTSLMLLNVQLRVFERLR